MVFFLSVAAAAAVVSALKPSYQSDATLLIDTRGLHYTDVRAVVDAPMQTSDLNWVRSEQQILSSDGLARRVIESLRLQDNPDFRLGPSLAGRALIWLGLRQAVPPPTREQALEEALGLYRQRFNVFNDGKSFVISASFRAGTPELTRRVLAKHVETYVDDQKAAKEGAILRAEDWLQGELERLATKVHQGEQRGQQFRDDNHLLRSGGETVVDRQLAEVTSQLALARADLARRTARTGEILGGNADTDMLASELLQRLRQQEATLAQQVAAMQARFGDGYPALAAARAALADARRKIAAETGRARAAGTSDASIAETRVSELEQQVRVLERQAMVSNRAELQAQKLDRETDADRRLYDDLLGRSKEVAIQREIQDPDARVISEPSLPVVPAFPRRGLLMVVACCVAAVVAGAAALLRDRLASTEVSNLVDLEAAVGLPSLGVVPRVSRSRAGDLVLAPAPLSQGAAALNTLANSILFRLPDSPGQVVVVASAMPNEGKSVLSGILAQIMSDTGIRVLVIDADTRRRGLSRMVTAAPLHGLVDLLEGRCTLRDAILRRALNGVDVIFAERCPANPSGLLRRPRLREILDEARLSYDLILVDTPPLAAVDDCLPIAAHADATILVARQGRSSTYATDAALRRLRLTGVRILGAVLTCADPSRGRGAERRDLEAFRSLAGTYFSDGT